MSEPVNRAEDFRSIAEYLRQARLRLEGMALDYSSAYELHAEIRRAEVLAERFIPSIAFEEKMRGATAGSAS